MGRDFRELSVMKLLVLLATVVLASAKNINVKQLEYGFCDGAPQPGTIDELTVMPDPIELRTGATISISATLTLNEIVQTGSMVELALSKNLLGFPVPTPCLEIDGLHVGSCKYDADYLLEKFADFLCPAHFPDGQACATPLNPRPTEAETPSLSRSLRFQTSLPGSSGVESTTPPPL